MISELALQQFYALPYDRWEGYAAERSEILNFIRNNGIENVAFLTTDNHGTLQNQVFIDRFADDPEHDRRTRRSRARSRRTPSRRR